MNLIFRLSDMTISTRISGLSKLFYRKGTAGDGINLNYTGVKKLCRNICDKFRELGIIRSLVNKPQSHSQVNGSKNPIKKQDCDMAIVGQKIPVLTSSSASAESAKVHAHYNSQQPPIQGNINHSEPEHFPMHSGCQSQLQYNTGMSLNGIASPYNYNGQFPVGWNIPPWYHQQHPMPPVSTEPQFFNSQHLLHANSHPFQYKGRM
jgi:hypothetical protein